MAKKEKTESVSEFVNPFAPGVSYKEFVEAMGEKNVKEYCEGKLTTEQIEWLENDLKHYKQN